MNERMVTLATNPQTEKLKKQLVALTQRLTPTDSANCGIDFSFMIDLLGIDLDFSIHLPCPNPPTPGGLEQYLYKEIVVTTPSEVISGTLIAIQEDYIVMVEFDGSLVLIPLDKIEEVNEI